MSYVSRGRELGAVDASTFVANYNVRRGSQNENVRVVQFLLNVFGAGLVTDAIFGPLTETAVRGFQKANGLKIDGIVGPNTSRALQDDDSRNIGQSPPSGGSKLPEIPSPSGTGKKVAIALVLAALLAGGVAAAKKRKKRSNPGRGRRRRRSRR